MHWRTSVVYPMCEALRSDGRYRTIGNLSYSSPLNSVNGFIPDSESETEYPSFFEVASSMVAIRLDQVFFFLFYVHSAYRTSGLLALIGVSVLSLGRISLQARENFG